MKYDGEDDSSGSSTNMMDFDEDLNENIDDSSTDLLSPNDLSGTTTISSTALSVRQNENKLEDKQRIDCNINPYTRDKIDKNYEINQSTPKSKYGSKLKSIDSKIKANMSSRSSPASKTLDALSGLDAVGGGNLLLSSPPSLQGNEKNKNKTMHSGLSITQRTNQVTPTDKMCKENGIMYDIETHEKTLSSLTHDTKRVIECEIENNIYSPTSVNSSEHYSMHVIPFTSPAPLGIHIIQTSAKCCMVGQVYENSQSQHLGIQKGDIICDLKNGAKEAAYEDVIAWSSKHRSPQNPFLLMIKRPVLQMNHKVKKGSKRKGSNNSISATNNNFTSGQIERKNKNETIFMGLSISCQRCKTKDKSQLHHCLCPEATGGDPLVYDYIKAGLLKKCKRCKNTLRKGHRNIQHRHSDACPLSRKYIAKQRCINKIVSNRSVPFPVKCMHCITVKGNKERAYTPLLHHMLCKLHPKFDNSLVEQIKVGIDMNCCACKQIYENGIVKKKLEHSCKTKNSLLIKEDASEDIEGKSDDILESKKTQLSPAISSNEEKLAIKAHSKEDAAAQPTDGSALNSSCQALKQRQNLQLIQAGIEKGCKACLQDFNRGTLIADGSKRNLNCSYHRMKNEKNVLPDTNPCIEKKSHFDTIKLIHHNNEIVKSKYGKKSGEGNLIAVPVQLSENAQSPLESYTKTPAEITIAGQRENSCSGKIRISSTSLKQPRWESCPNPWGISGNLDVDKLLLAPDFPPTLTERFVISPLSIPLYQQVYKHGQYKVLRLIRDRLTLRPWGFEVKRCDKNGACIVAFVAPCSPAECAQDVGIEQNMNLSESCSNGLCVQDLVLCINGQMVGGMNHIEFLSQLDICGSELILVVARSKNPQFEADWIDFDSEKSYSVAGENTIIYPNESQSKLIDSSDSVLNCHKKNNLDECMGNMILGRNPTETTNIIENMDSVEAKSPMHSNKNIKLNSPTFEKPEQTRKKMNDYNLMTRIDDFISQRSTVDHRSIEKTVKDGVSQFTSDLMDTNSLSQINKRVRSDRPRPSSNLSITIHEKKKSELMIASTSKHIPQKDQKQIQNCTLQSCDSETNDICMVQKKTQCNKHPNEMETDAVRGLLNFGNRMLTNGGDFQMKKEISTNKLDSNMNKNNISYADSSSFEKSITLKKRTSNINSIKTLTSHNTDAAVEYCSSTDGEMVRGDKVNSKFDNYEIDVNHSTTDIDDEEESMSSESNTNGCVCGKVHPPPIAVFWILCDKCDEWYNVANDCVGFGREEAQEMETWNCWSCTRPQKDEKRKSVEKDAYNSNDVPITDDILQTKAKEKIEIDYSSSDESYKNPEDKFLPPTETFSVGAVVNVIKRTWPGVNKLGGVGKIQEVHGSIEKNDLNYTIVYILGGREKNVDAKYVSEVSDMKEDIKSPSMSTRSCRGRLSLS